jgi:hypothetical protein
MFARETESSIRPGEERGGRRQNNLSHEQELDQARALYPLVIHILLSQNYAKITFSVFSRLPNPRHPRLFTSQTRIEDGKKSFIARKANDSRIHQAPMP